MTVALVTTACSGDSGGPDTTEVVAAAERGCEQLRVRLDDLPADPSEDPGRALAVAREALDDHGDALLDLPRASGETLDVVNDLHVPSEIEGALTDLRVAIDDGIEEQPVDPAGARADIERGVDELNRASAEHGIDTCAPAEPFVAVADALTGQVSETAGFDFTGDFVTDLGALCSDFATAQLGATPELGLPGASAGNAMSRLASAAAVLLARLDAIEVPDDRQADVEPLVAGAQEVAAAARRAADLALSVPNAYEDARVEFDLLAADLEDTFTDLGASCDADPVEALGDG